MLTSFVATTCDRCPMPRASRQQLWAPFKGHPGPGPSGRTGPRSREVRPCVPHQEQDRHPSRQRQCECEQAAASRASRWVVLVGTPCPPLRCAAFQTKSPLPPLRGILWWRSLFLPDGRARRQAVSLRDGYVGPRRSGRLVVVVEDGEIGSGKAARPQCSDDSLEITLAVTKTRSLPERLGPT